MADAARAQRLLAAKKKVKEYQKYKKNKIETDTKTPAESLTNSTHSSLNEIQTLDDNETSNQIVQSVSPLQQYFTGGNASIFDEISNKNNSNSQDFYKFDVISYNKDDEVCNKSTTSGKDEFGDTSQVTQDSVAMEDPEIDPNEIYNRLNRVDNSFSKNGTEQIHFSDFTNIPGPKDNVNNVTETTNTLNELPTGLSSNQEDIAKLYEFSSQIDSNRNAALHLRDDVNNVAENMQSLKQLSTQIIQMIDDNIVNSPQQIPMKIEAEHKNEKVYEYLKAEQDKCMKLYEEAIAYRKHIAELEDKSHKLQENEEKRAQELKQLSERIQCYQQTVDILVSEKSELANLLSQRENAAKLKNTECEELSARLKTSRSRVADLEKELSILRTEKQDRKSLEQNSEYQKVLKDYELLRNQNEETLQDVSELRWKLTNSTEENLKLRTEVQDLTSQLSLLNIKLQQLSSGVDNNQFNGHIEGLTQQINMFEKQVIDLNNVIKTLSMEKEQTSVQYQQYVQQLNGQLTGLAQKLEEKSLENEALVLREQQLTNQMTELEKLLQKMQNDQHVVINKGGADSLRKEHEEALASLKTVQEEKALLEESYQLVIGERDDAFKDLNLKKEEVTQLEEEINRLQSNQPDNAKLLAIIESDKVAASRAVAQNGELKKQLEEIQQAFIQMSNNKLELTELLDDQKHKNKELNEKLNQFESQVHTLTTAIEMKDREMITLRESAQDLNKYMVQQNQLEDRLRHYEAHDHSTHALQRELQDSYQKIQNLRSENETLKFHLKNAEDKNKKFEMEKHTTQDSSTSEDKTVLLSRIEDLERRNREMESKLLQSQSPTQNTVEDLGQTQAEPSIVTDEVRSGGDINQQMAMKQLEEKFTKTMQEIADLEDEKQRLEHLVLQLQDETETIGEYVTLYQHQRGVLKQRALERDAQMRQLTLDREQMKVKVDRLNELIKALLTERGSIPEDLLDKHMVDKQQLCAEHAKVHEETPLVPNQNGLNNNTKTAEKIIELLCDIKTSNLVQPSEATEAFHPCPWCSGQLITV